LPKHDFVIVAATHSLSHVFHHRHVLFRAVIGNDRAGRRRRRRRDLRGVAGQSACGNTFALEVVLVALHLFLLTIHEPDVVAQEEVQVLMAVAWQFLSIGSNWNNRS